MSTLAEIEQAIEALPPAELKALTAWLEHRLLTGRSAEPTDAVEGWLKRARGTADPGLTTDAVLAATRGEE